MIHFESSSFKFLLWSLILQAVLAFELPETPANNSEKNLARMQVATDSLYEQYTLGQMEDAAKIIYTHQQTQAYDETQEKISLDFNYPDSNDGDLNEIESSTIITQVQLFVKVKDGSNTQAYVLDGGIGRNNISLQIVASNSSLLNYMLVIYGKAAQ